MQETLGRQEEKAGDYNSPSLERQFITLAGVPFSHNSLKTRGGNQDQQGRLKRVDPLDRVR